MNTWLLVPPIAFLIVLAVMLLQLKGFSIFSSQVKMPEHPGGRLKSYACGEDVKDARVQPEYRQFFPFAFFFTIMHVVAMIIATVPAGSRYAVGLAAFYLVGAAIGLFILFRKEDA